MFFILITVAASAIMVSTITPEKSVDISEAILPTSASALNVISTRCKIVAKKTAQAISIIMHTYLRDNLFWVDKNKYRY